MSKKDLLAKRILLALTCAMSIQMLVAPPPVWAEETVQASDTQQTTDNSSTSDNNQDNNITPGQLVVDQSKPLIGYSARSAGSGGGTGNGDLEAGEPLNYGIMPLAASSTVVMSEDTALQSIAIGTGAAYNNYRASVAVGINAKTWAADTVALGQAAAARGERATALGPSADSQADSVAAGYYARANKQYSTSIGAWSVVEHDNSVAIGYKSNSSKTNQVSFGTWSGSAWTTTRELAGISNIAMGGTLTGVTNITMSGEINGVSIVSNQNNSIGIGSIASAIGTYTNSVAVGANSSVRSNNQVSFGTWNVGTSTWTTTRSLAGINDIDMSGAINGVPISGNAMYSIAIGQGATVSALVANAANIAIGNSATTNANNAIAIGKSASSSYANSIAIGSSTSTSKDNQVSFGTWSGSAWTSRRELAGISSIDMNGTISGLTGINTVTVAGASATTGLTIGGNAIIGKTNTPFSSTGFSVGSTGAITASSITALNSINGVTLAGTSVTTGLTFGSNAIIGKTNTPFSSTGFNVNQSGDITAGRINGMTIIFDVNDISMVIGNGNSTAKEGSISIGDSTYSEDYSISIGTGAVTKGGRSIALGPDSQALENASIAIGSGASSTGEASIAFGAGSIAGDKGSIALGTNSKTMGLWTIAIGDGANVLTSNSIALGANTVAKFRGSVAIGYASKTSKDNQVSFGDWDGTAWKSRRELAGISDIDMDGAITGAKTVNGMMIEYGSNESIALGAFSAGANADSSISIGDGGGVVNGKYSIAIGSTASTYTDNSIAIGTESLAVGIDSVALGVRARAEYNNSVAIGATSQTSKDNQVAFGTWDGSAWTARRELAGISDIDMDGGIKGLTSINSVAVAGTSAATGLTIGGNATIGKTNTPFSSTGFSVGSTGALTAASLTATGSSTIGVVTLNGGNITLGTNGTVNGVNISTLNTTVSGKADKSTTLAGYGITDAYTKSTADTTFAKLDASNLTTTNQNSWKSALGVDKLDTATTGMSYTATGSKTTFTTNLTAASLTAAGSSTIGGVTLQDNTVNGLVMNSSSQYRYIYISSSSMTPGSESVGLGYGAKASGYYAIAIGSFAKALESGSIAIGAYAQSNHNYSVAIGEGITTKDYQVSFGYWDGTAWTKRLELAGISDIDMDGGIKGLTSINSVAVAGTSAATGLTIGGNATIGKTNIPFSSTGFSVGSTGALTAASLTATGSSTIGGVTLNGGNITLGTNGTVNGVNISTLNTTVSGKADKATTLAGYGIKDAMTSTDINTELGKKANVTDLATKANTADVYTKTLADSTFAKAADLTSLTTTVGTKANMDASNLTATNKTSWKAALGVDTLNTTVTNLSTTVGGKADKSTTLTGYGITDAYTKTLADSTFAKAADLSGVKTATTNMAYTATGNKTTFTTNLAATSLTATGSSTIGGVVLNNSGISSLTSINTVTVAGTSATTGLTIGGNATIGKTNTPFSSTGFSVGSTGAITAESINGVELSAKATNMVIGYGVVGANSYDGIILGNATINAGYAIALGTDASANHMLSVAIGAYSSTSKDSQVSFATWNGKAWVERRELAGISDIDMDGGIKGLTSINTVTVAGTSATTGLTIGGNATIGKTNTPFSSTGFSVNSTGALTAASLSATGSSTIGGVTLNGNNITLTGTVDGVDVSTLNSNVSTLTTTVGNSTSGLVKDTADLKTAVGNASSGLTKSVNDLTTTVGGKADKSTTLAGYGITDAYDKATADTTFAKSADLSGVKTATTGMSYASNKTTFANAVAMNSLTIGSTSYGISATGALTAKTVNGLTMTGTDAGKDAAVGGYSLKTMADNIAALQGGGGGVTENTVAIGHTGTVNTSDSVTTIENNTTITQAGVTTTLLTADTAKLGTVDIAAAGVVTGVASINGVAFSNDGKVDGVDISALDTVVNHADTGLVKQVSDLDIAYQAADSALDARATALETTVGDSSKGLVKDMSELSTLVGDSSTGLVKDVDDLQTATTDMSYANNKTTFAGAVAVNSLTIGSTSYGFAADGALTAKTVNGLTMTGTDAAKNAAVGGYSLKSMADSIAALQGGGGAATENTVGIGHTGTVNTSDSVTTIENNTTITQAGVTTTLLTADTAKLGTVDIAAAGVVTGVASINGVAFSSDGKVDGVDISALDTVVKHADTGLVKQVSDLDGNRAKLDASNLSDDNKTAWQGALGVTTLDTNLTALTEKVGDETKGLVKDIKTNTTDIGTLNTAVTANTDKITVLETNTGGISVDGGMTKLANGFKVGATTYGMATDGSLTTTSVNGVTIDSTDTTIDGYSLKSMAKSIADLQGGGGAATENTVGIGHTGTVNTSDSVTTIENNTTITQAGVTTTLLTADTAKLGTVDIAAAGVVTGVASINGVVFSNDGKIDGVDLSVLDDTVNNTSTGLVKQVSDLDIAYQAADSALDARATALETTVGDSSKGLVKDMSELSTLVGDSSTGLVKDVDDLQTATTDMSYANNKTTFANAVAVNSLTIGSSSYGFTADGDLTAKTVNGLTMTGTDAGKNATVGGYSLKSIADDINTLKTNGGASSSNTVAITHTGDTATNDSTTTIELNTVITESGLTSTTITANEFIEGTTKLSDKYAAKATDLAGYGITDAYTVADIDSQMSDRADKDAGNISGADIGAWQTKLGVDTLTTDVNALQTDIGDLTTAVADNSSDISTLQNVVGDSGSGLVQSVDNLNTTIATKANQTDLDPIANRTQDMLFANGTTTFAGQVVAASFSAAGSSTIGGVTLADGNISLAGTVDGVDVSALKDKVDNLTPGSSGGGGANTAGISRSGAGTAQDAYKTTIEKNTAITETGITTTAVTAAEFVEGSSKLSDKYAAKAAVDTLTGVVGDNNTGLVKDMTELSDIVSNGSTGLVKYVDDLKTATTDMSYANNTTTFAGAVAANSISVGNYGIASDGTLTAKTVNGVTITGTDAAQDASVGGYSLKDIADDINTLKTNGGASSANTVGITHTGDTSSNDSTTVIEKNTAITETGITTNTVTAADFVEGSSKLSDKYAAKAVEEAVSEISYTVAGGTKIGAVSIKDNALDNVGYINSFEISKDSQGIMIDGVGLKDLSKKVRKLVDNGGVGDGSNTAGIERNDVDANDDGTTVIEMNTRIDKDGLRTINLEASSGKLGGIDFGNNSIGKIAFDNQGFVTSINGINFGSNGSIGGVMLRDGKVNGVDVTALQSRVTKIENNGGGGGGTGGGGGENTAGIARPDPDKGETIIENNTTVNQDGIYTNHVNATDKIVIAEGKENQVVISEEGIHIGKHSTLVNDVDGFVTDKGLYVGVDKSDDPSTAKFTVAPSGNLTSKAGNYTFSNTSSGGAVFSHKGDTVATGGQFGETTIKGNTITTGTIETDQLLVGGNVVNVAGGTIAPSNAVDVNLQTNYDNKDYTNRFQVTETAGTIQTHKVVDGDTTQEFQIKSQYDGMTMSSNKTVTTKDHDGNITDTRTTTGTTSMNGDSINLNKETIHIDKDGKETKTSSSTTIDSGEIYLNNDGQSIAVGSTLTGLQSDVRDLDNKVSRMGNEIKEVGALSAALAGLHPMPEDANTRTSMAMAMGSYEGKQAIAVGGFYRPNKRTLLSIGGSFTSSKQMFNMGVSFALDKMPTPKPYKGTEMKPEMNSEDKETLQMVLARLDEYGKKLDKVEQDNKKLEEDNKKLAAEYAALKAKYENN